MEELNRLLGIALERRHRAGGIVTPQVNPHRPWLPLSYWDEQRVQEVTADILDLAEHMREVKLHRAYQDAHLAKQDAASVMAEWDDELPTLQGSSEVLARAGWGRHRMRGSGGELRTPAPPDQMQPVYNNVCQFCHRPITAVGYTWKDHAGKVNCPDRYDGQYIADHVPEGVEVDDEFE